MKIAFFDTKPYDREYFTEAALKYGFPVKFFEPKLNADTVGLTKGFDAVCVFVNDTLDETVIDRLAENGVGLIALRCAGFNQVDLRAAYGKVRVVRVPAYSPYAVAEHAMAMLLCMNRRLHKAYQRTREFNFSLNGLTGFDLYGRTVGVIGTGKIGKVFSDICRGFGMRVFGYDRFQTDPKTEYVSLDTIFRESDVISLHCPLSPETYHLIGRRAFSEMKKGAILINTSRGALIDSEDLVIALKEGKLGAACLDVYEEESELFFEDNSDQIVHDDVLARLLGMPNVLVTSHQAFLTDEALTNIAETTCANIHAYEEGRELNHEVLYSPDAEGKMREASKSQ